MRCASSSVLFSCAFDPISSFPFLYVILRYTFSSKRSCFLGLAPSFSFFASTSPTISMSINLCKTLAFDKNTTVTTTTTQQLEQLSVSDLLYSWFLHFFVLFCICDANIDPFLLTYLINHVCCRKRSKRSVVDGKVRFTDPEQNWIVTDGTIWILFLSSFLPSFT
jgi:hypothetical protein